MVVISCAEDALKCFGPGWTTKAFAKSKNAQFDLNMAKTLPKRPAGDYEFDPPITQMGFHQVLKFLKFEEIEN